MRRNVVAVFTDYNEHSGRECAKLGGSRGAATLSVNPFRQPVRSTHTAKGTEGRHTFEQE